MPGHGGVGPWEAVLLARAASLASLLCVLSSRIVMTFVCALEWEFRSSAHLKVEKTPLGSCFLHSGHLKHERKGKTCCIFQSQRIKRVRTLNFGVVLSATIYTSIRVRIYSPETEH